MDVEAQQRFSPLFLNFLDNFAFVGTMLSCDRQIHHKPATGLMFLVNCLYFFQFGVHVKCPYIRFLIRSWILENRAIRMEKKK